ncbi:MAG: ACP S-malonyltransferase [Myxococcota bacterium]
MFAVVFPGQGSQVVGMSTDLAREFPAARRVFDEADEALGEPLSRWIGEGPEEVLRRTEITQPAILTASIAAWRVIETRLDRPPGALAGHSLGEYSALVAAGALAFPDAVRLVRKRGAFMQEAVPEGQGAMAAVVGLSAEAVEQICAEIAGPVAAANLNAPTQVVIAGTAAAVDSATEALRAAGARRIVRLEVSAPFHSRLMKPAMERLAEELAQTPFSDLRTPVVSNVTAEPYTRADQVRGLLREQVCAPVRWVDCVRRLVSLGATVELEVGPGKVLSGLAARIDRGLAHAHVGKVAELAEGLAQARKTG